MSGQFTVKLTPAFARDLEKLPLKNQEYVLAAIAVLENNPFGPPPGVKKLKGKGIGQWRLRIGNYRVRYDIIQKDVVLYRVRHRKDIYRDQT